MGPLKDTHDRETAERIASRQAVAYAAAIEKLGVSYADVAGGSADHARFMLDLKDGRSIEGDARQAHFS